MSARGLLYLSVFLVISQSLAGQNADAVRYIQEHSNLEALRQMAEAQKIQDSLDFIEVQQWAEENNQPIRFTTQDGRRVQLVKIRQGHPMYLITYNSDAAISTQTNQLYSGGAAGLKLDGSGITIGEWDGGAVRATHEQLLGRVTQRDTPSVLSNHATHVAGTLIGDGTGNTSAKGMAPGAVLDAYDWNYDESEMIDAAASGLLLSNHSYGFLTGWNGNEWWGDTSYSFKEDVGFGAYTYWEARRQDEIAKNAPFYLIIKSAGNDRNDFPPGFPGSDGNTYYYAGDNTPFIYDSSDPKRSPEKDGGNDDFDGIGWKGNAKNILTIGAVNDVLNYTGPGSVSLASFSNFGPTDDGRIKPDLVGNGISLESSGALSDNDYYFSSGTSMSAPNVTGSLALLQEHYLETHSNVPMRASTLKALAIHTARECGTATGPDYRFGWGLLSAADAAEVISQDTLNPQTILEDTLANGNQQSFSFKAAGNQPLRITLAYTDEPGPSQNALNSTTPRLVNDLDITLNDGTITTLPYVLDPSNPSAAATTGDNDRDNVEQIYLANPVAGQTYTLILNHEGSLASDQVYSLIITGAQGSYYSVAACSTGCNLNDLANWNSERNGSGFAPATFESGDHFVVQNGHQGQLSADWELANPNGLLEIESNAQIDIGSSRILEVAGAIKNNGVFNIANAGALVQTHPEDLNHGNGVYHVTRNTGNLVDHSRFQYWSATVDTATMGHVFAGANPNDFYQYTPSASPSWQLKAGNQIMTPGRGYATTPTVNSSAQNFNENRTFSGQVNNGAVTYSESAAANDFMLVGNPYPSPISSTAFIDANPNLFGALYFWNHSTPVSAFNGNGNNTNQDYAIWNYTGAISGNNNEAPDDYVQSSQGFFVQAQSALTEVEFSNAMRAATSNAQFFKNAQKQQLWLSLRKDSTLSNQLLIGFLPDATFGRDRLYDALKFSGNPNLSFYSLLNSQAFGIQGFPRLRLSDFTVALEAYAGLPGPYVITLDSLNQWDPSYQVWLEDRQVDTLQILDLHPWYQFSLAQPDSLKNRFFLHFKKATGLGDQKLQKNQPIQVRRSDQFLVVTNPYKQNLQIGVYNLNGQLLAQFRQKDKEQRHFAGALPRGIYVVEVSAQSQNQQRIKLFWY